MLANEQPELDFTVGMILYPNFTLQDLVGPYEVFVRMPQSQVQLIATTLEPVRTDRGLLIHPHIRFDDAPLLDLLFVPGGPDAIRAADDQNLMDFLKRQGEQAKLITSVCTGSLLLAAVGLLSGYRATTHWAWRNSEFLEIFGAKTVSERVVIDRNRITGAGVTSGIDFALRVASLLHGENVAQRIQLALEYDPEPPFQCGSPKSAPIGLVEQVSAPYDERVRAQRKQAQRLADQWHERLST